jgi:hypothetical protein
MGPRLEPVSDTKYAGMVGCRILWDMGGIKQFSPTVFRVLDEFRPWLWYTSEILQLTRVETRTYELETANTIYVLEELDGD